MTPAKKPTTKKLVTKPKAATDPILEALVLIDEAEERLGRASEIAERETDFKPDGTDLLTEDMTLVKESLLAKYGEAQFAKNRSK